MTTASDQPTSDPPAPFLTVVTRTQGRRPRLLQETLASLSTQTDTDFEVLLVRHDGDDEIANRRDAEAVRRVLEAAPSIVRSRIRPLVAPPGRRGVPLNVGLDAGRGRYAAFLDDDDLARPNWVAAFRSAADVADGMVLRARAAVQDLCQGRDDEGGYRLLGEPAERYPARFDLADHLFENRTPIASLAWPLEELRRHDLRVDEELEALEDWDLLLRVATVCGVHDVGAATAIYRWWTDSAGSRGAETDAGYARARRRVLDRWAARPLTLVPPFPAQLHAAAAELAAFRRFAAELAVDPESGPVAAGATPPEVVTAEFTRLHRKAAGLIADLVAQHAELAACHERLAVTEAELRSARRLSLWRLAVIVRAVRRRRGGGR